MSVEIKGCLFGVLVGIVLVVALWACVPPVSRGPDGGAQPGEQMAYEWYKVAGNSTTAWVFHFPDGTNCYQVGNSSIWCK